MSDVLQALTMQGVEIRSQADRADYRDDGIFQIYDDRRVVIEKDSDERLYFPITSVRLLQPLR